jgi:hypothetical protein
MLATLLKHTGRYAQATEQLDRLEQLIDAGRWTVEIDAERRAIERLMGERPAEPLTTGEPPTIAEPRKAA